MKTPITIGETTAQCGEKVRGKLLAGEFSTGTEVYLPFIIINGAEDGNTVWVNACVHGNELNGTLAAQKLAREIDPKDVRGAVIITPICNPLAYREKKRLSFLEGNAGMGESSNMGEVFPGRMDGTMTEKLAYVLFCEIKRLATAVVDLHCWGFGQDSKPYTVIKKYPDEKISQEILNIAKVFGSPMICTLDMTQKLNEPSPVDKQMDVFAGYVDFRQDINSWLSLDAGVRIDHHSHVGTEWIPQGGLAFHLPRQAELKAMVSKGFRNPTIREMYMFPPQNPDLKAESLMNYELSFTGQLLGGAMSYGVNLYYINGDNIIMTDPALRKNVNSGEIENWGVETNLGYRINRHWQMNANYSWLHMENPVLAAPEHKLYAGADFTQGRWSLSTGIQYVKGLHTSVTPGKEKQESFVLWNLRANYRLCSFADVFVKGENLLAQRYEINAGFPMPKATVMGGVNINF